MLSHPWHPWCTSGFVKMSVTPVKLSDALGFNSEDGGGEVQNPFNCRDPHWLGASPSAELHHWRRNACGQELDA
jgi:hypothetical protein